MLLGARAQDWLERSVGPLIAKDGTGLASLLPIGRFRIYTVTGSLPSRSRADYRLQRRRPRRPAVHALATTSWPRCSPPTLTRDFQCVTGWRVHDVAWKGVRLVRRARPRRRAAGRDARCGSHSFDGVYTESLTLEQARRDDVIVAYELEGSPLSDAHGGPVRLYVAPMYGYKSMKWLDAHRAHRATSRRATGRCAATTSTAGSADRTDATTMPPDARARDPCVAAAEPPLLRFDRVERARCTG